jgi:hypothetical protein
VILGLPSGSCFSQHTRTGLNWINVLLGLWTMISPLVYGYTANTGGLEDNLILEFFGNMAPFINHNCLYRDRVHDSSHARSIEGDRFRHRTL